VGLIRDLPFPDLSDELMQRISTLTFRCMKLVQDSLCETDETAIAFLFPPGLADAKPRGLRDAVTKAVARREERLIELSKSSAELDELVANAFNFSPSDQPLWEKSLSFRLTNCLTMLR